MKRRWMTVRAFKNSFWKNGRSAFILDIAQSHLLLKHSRETSHLFWLRCMKMVSLRVPGSGGYYSRSLQQVEDGGRGTWGISIKGKGTRWWSKIKAEVKIGQQGVAARRECEDFVGTLWRTETSNLILWFVLLGYHVLISLAHVHTHSSRLLSKNHQQEKNAKTEVHLSQWNTPITERTGKLQEIS